MLCQWEEGRGVRVSSMVGNLAVDQEFIQNPLGLPSASSKSQRQFGDMKALPFDGETVEAEASVTSADLSTYDTTFVAGVMRVRTGYIVARMNLGSPNKFNVLGQVRYGPESEHATLPPINMEPDRGSC